ncbi:hypothetical protein CDAR_377491 [Caerostris darwini]|uniref:Cilia- and flagella-associated protein 299 n=1 Tax=Caerostris darwini TaxID=1538125 RepID=A0AAV4VZX4_9ARAC|nr:hypothetical protein CDAR_377491 [Caerostris darwini]
MLLLQEEMRPRIVHFLPTDASPGEQREDNLSGCLATIIFVRDVNEKGEEVSAYMDYAHRLKTENWTVYFKGEKKLVPLESDLRQVHGYK